MAGNHSMIVAGNYIEQARERERRTKRRAGCVWIAGRALGDSGVIL